MKIIDNLLIQLAPRRSRMAWNNDKRFISLPFRSNSARSRQQPTSVKLYKLKGKFLG